jgi:transcription initiation factor TFIIIB Brf1 subunit/transcription initiation factor TFIIB
MNPDSSDPESIKCSTDDRLHVPITDHESGEVICGNCGIVLITTDSFGIDNSQEQELEQEQLAFTSSQTEGNNNTIGIKTGAYLSLLSRHDRGLATIIGRPK